MLGSIQTCCYFSGLCFSPLFLFCPLQQTSCGEFFYLQLLFILPKATSARLLSPPLQQTCSSPVTSYPAGYCSGQFFQMLSELMNIWYLRSLLSCSHIFFFFHLACRIPHSWFSTLLAPFSWSLVRSHFTTFILLFIPHSVLLPVLFFSLAYINF